MIARPDPGFVMIARPDPGFVTLDLKGASLVLAAFLVLGSASVAAADGTWVVWKRTIGPDSDAWSIEEAYLNRPQCQGFGIKMALTQDMRLARTHPDYQDLERGEDGTSYRFVKTKPDGSGTEPIQVRFICLPDTIDPRETQK